MDTKKFETISQVNGDLLTVILSERSGDLYVNGELDYSFSVSNMDRLIRDLLDEGFKEVTA